MGFGIPLNLRGTLLIAALVLGSCSLTDAQEVFGTGFLDVDYSGVNPDFLEQFEAGEAFWESRISNYSTDLPPAILVQLTTLKLTASTPLIDGPGMILGQAAVTSVLSYQSSKILNAKNVVVPVTGFLELDLADLGGPTTQSTIIHEMGHVLGIGSLWFDNDLIAPVGGVGPIQYIGGKYALRTFRSESGRPSTLFIPIQQTGGPGSALSHWQDDDEFFNQAFTSGIKKETMTPFASTFNPSTGRPVLVPFFTSETTWASLADLGYEVSGINDNVIDPPRSKGVGRWPKITGSGLDPFVNTGVVPDPDLRYRIVDIRATYWHSKEALENANPVVVKTNQSADPYGLRNHSWSKK